MSKGIAARRHARARLIARRLAILRRGDGSYVIGRRGAAPAAEDYYERTPGRLDKHNLTCDCWLCTKLDKAHELLRCRPDGLLYEDWAEFVPPLVRQWHRSPGRYRRNSQ
jgi:hypothetical protein